MKLEIVNGEDGTTYRADDVADFVVDHPIIGVLRASDRKSVV